MATPSTSPPPLPPVVFIHGWKASVLADKNNDETEFDYTLGTLLGITPDPKLELPLEFDTYGNQVKDNLLATEPCHSARFCGIKIGPIYGPLLDHLEETRDLRPFAYDWRRPLGETATLFQEFLHQVKEECDQPAQVVGHSMGCLITLSVLNKHPHLFHSVLFGAGAFSPSVSILKDLSLLGEKNVIVKNTTMFTPKVHLSHPASFHFLPCVGEREKWGKSHVDLFFSGESSHATSTITTNSTATTTTSVQYNLHDVETWKRLKIGIFHPESGIDTTTLEEDDPQQLLFDSWLQLVLNKARIFREGLLPPPPPPLTTSTTSTSDLQLNSDYYPPITVLRGDYVDTEFGYVVVPSSNDDNNVGDGGGILDLKNNIIYFRGDGRIVLEDALPPQGIPVLKVVTNDREHSQVLNDIENVRMLLDLMLLEKK